MCDVRDMFDVRCVMCDANFTPGPESTKAEPIPVALGKKTKSYITAKVNYTLQKSSLYITKRLIAHYKYVNYTLPKS